MTPVEQVDTKMRQNPTQESLISLKLLVLVCVIQKRAGVVLCFVENSCNTWRHFRPQFDSLSVEFSFPFSISFFGFGTKFWSVSLLDATSLINLSAFPLSNIYYKEIPSPIPVSGCENTSFFFCVVIFAVIPRVLVVLWEERGEIRINIISCKQQISRACIL